MAAIHKQKDMDMTDGSIVKLLIIFALPLLIGNVFQQLYNTVDSIIVGNFVSKQALAAVGCTGPIINSLIGLFSGLATGAGVVISQYYGAKDREKLYSSVQTTIALTVIMCVVLTVLGVLVTPYLLRLMDTPEDVFADAAEYLKIYFMGVSGLLFYNIGSGILRSVGDSKHPLYFLIFSTIANTILDVVFVKYFNMGIAGAAIATVIAQALSAVLVIGLLILSKADYRIDLKGLRLNGRILRRICLIGVPSAIQLAITAFSNIFVQSYINQFESSCMAGWAAYMKIDSFGLMPMMSLSIAITTFIGQNLGAGKLGRAKKGTSECLKIAFTVMALVLIPLMIFAPQLVSMFNKDPEVVSFGTLFVRLCSPFYLLCCINQVYSGSLRGAGDTRSTMIILLSSFVVFRQLYLFIVSRLGGGIVAIAMGYPAGWLMASTILLVYYHSGTWLKKLKLQPEAA